MSVRAVTPSADPARPIPATAAERAVVIEAALGSLRDEERRLARLGFEIPLARCHQQLRYWEFVRALNEMSELRSAA